MEELTTIKNPHAFIARLYGGATHTFKEVRIGVAELGELVFMGDPNNPNVRKWTQFDVEHWDDERLIVEMVD